MSPMTKDIVLGKKYFGLWIGPPGAGKTVQAAVWGEKKDGKVYIFDCDGRMDPIKLMWPNADDIEYDTYTQDDFEYFDQKCQYLKRNIGDYRAIVLDSLTSFARMLLRYSLSQRSTSGKKEKEADLRRGKIQLYDIVEFNAEARGLSQVIDFFRTLKCHFIMTAHLIRVADKKLNGQEVVTLQLLTGGKKIAAELPSYFNEIWYFYNLETFDPSKPAEFKVRTTGMGEVFCKTALPVKPEYEHTRRKLYDLVKVDLNTYGISFDPQGTVAETEEQSKIENPFA